MCGKESTICPYGQHTIYFKKKHFPSSFIPVEPVPHCTEHKADNTHSVCAPALDVIIPYSERYLAELCD